PHVEPAGAAGAAPVGRRRHRDGLGGCARHAWLNRPMDPRLLRYYNQELRYLREMGGEFAREFPKIAGRLGMEGMEVADPYVERLIEGAAFLAARVQLKQDAEYPQLSQRLLEMICPNLSAPVPSMLVARIKPSNDPNLINGFRIARGSTLIG